MLMVFIWLGSLVPEKHYKVLSDCQDHPGNKCVLLQNYHFDYYLQKYKTLLGLSQERLDRLIMVEKIDLLRLFYLYEKGGVYSDLDNYINYTCLENFIQFHNLAQFFGQQQGEPWFPNNNFIYAPTPKDPRIEYVIKKIKQCESCQGWMFASPFMLRRIGHVNFLNVRQCIQHGYQNSWRYDSGSSANNLITPDQARIFSKCQKQLQEFQKSNTAKQEQLGKCKKQIQGYSIHGDSLLVQNGRSELLISKTSEDLQNCKKKIKLSVKILKVQQLNSKQLLSNYKLAQSKYKLFKKIVVSQSSKCRNWSKKYRKSRILYKSSSKLKVKVKIESNKFLLQFNHLKLRCKRYHPD